MKVLGQITIIISVIFFSKAVYAIDDKARHQIFEPGKEIHLTQAQSQQKPTRWQRFTSRLKRKPKQGSTPRATPQRPTASPQQIAQQHSERQQSLRAARQRVQQQASQPGGFQINQGRAEQQRPVIGRPQRSPVQPPARTPIPTTTQTGANIYFTLYQALKWKLESLTNQLQRRERDLKQLPEDLKVRLTDLQEAKKTDLISWAYPKLIEAMLQLSSEAYVRTRIKKSTKEFIEEREIAEKLKDSYTLQRKIFELENKIKSLEKLIRYIDEYRNRMISLLVNHIRVTHDLEPLIGINKSQEGTSLQFGVRAPENLSPEETEKTKQVQTAAEQLRPVSPKPLTNLGKLSVNDTGPSVVQYLLATTPKIFPFKEYFGTEIKLNSIADILTYMGRLQGVINDEVIAYKKELEELDDPNMRIAFGVIGKLALEGFEPKAVLYRNTGKEKEYSGTIFYRDAKVPEKCGMSRYKSIQDPILEGKIDYKTFEKVASQLQVPEQQKQTTAADKWRQASKKAVAQEAQENVIKDVIVIAYSGSKSKADWEKNFAFIAKEVSGENPLLWGYKVHDGIARAFEEGYTDLGARGGEMMLNIKRKTERYLNKCPNARVELYIITTGHSLGGGLSTLAAIAMKKKAELFENVDRLSVHVSNISFAAPPVFRRDVNVGKTKGGVQVRYDWAQRAEDYIGRSNVLRVFVDRDPVSTFSLFRQRTGKIKNPEARSLIMTLLNYKHIGIPLMLYDIEGFFDDFELRKGIIDTFWKPHMMPRYGLLVSLFANSRFLRIRDYIQDFNNRGQLDALKFRISEYAEALKTVEEAIAAQRKAINENREDEILAIMDKILEENAGLIAEYEEIQTINEILEGKKDIRVADLEAGQFGPDLDVKLGRAEVKTVTFKPFYPDFDGENIFMYSTDTIKLTGRTSCEANKFWNTNILRGKFSLKPGYTPSIEIKEKMACSCCLVKNLVLAQGRFGTRVRQASGRKGPTESIEQVFSHCIRKNRCTRAEINAQIDFQNYPNQFSAVRDWLNKLEGNAAQSWTTKSVSVVK